MKKILIALAVAGTLIAPAAMADTSNVNVYGEVNVSIDMVKSGETAGSVKTNQLSSNSSRLGFKGSEDLGGGVSAIFQIESGFNADGTGNSCSANTTSTPASGVIAVNSVDCTNENTLGTRNTFAGLKSDVGGSLTLGRQDTPYKVSTRDLDLFADGIADNRSLMGGGIDGHDRRTTDTIAYMSPSWGGFSVAAAYVLGAEYASNTADTKGKGISIAGMYDMAPFYVTVAHQKISHGTSGTGQFDGGDGNSDKAYKVGGGFKTDMFAVNAVIENIKSVSLGGAQEDKFRTTYLAGQFNITSNDAVKLAFTKVGNNKQNGVEDSASGAKQISFGYDHNLSKRTTVYALYTRLSNKANIDNCLSGASSTGGPASCSNDADPAALSFGMKHSF